jgi:hypothetical protein
MLSYRGNLDSRIPMKRTLLLLSSLCLALAPVLPAQASLVAEDKAPVDNLHCLALLLTDSEAHAKECGGPFEVDKSTQTIVSPVVGCEVGSADLSLYGLDPEVWRLQVAYNPCCATVQPLSPHQPAFGQWVLPVGERVLVAC